MKFHPAATPPEGESGKWTREVLVVCDNYQFYKIAFFNPTNAGYTGAWQRTNAMAEAGAQPIAWTELPWDEVQQAVEQGPGRRLPVLDMISDEVRREILAEQALRYVFGDIPAESWQRIIDQGLAPPPPLPNHAKRMGLTP